jgi:dipeptidyl aminopeptidase/acylaminoacyl peptidase
MGPNSFARLVGEGAPAALRREVSVDLHVSAQTPPAFIWHTYDDAMVPVANSLILAEALRKHGVPFELHVYAAGRHGLALADDDPHVATWMDLCCQWLRDLDVTVGGEL